MARVKINAVILKAPDGSAIDGATVLITLRSSGLNATLWNNEIAGVTLSNPITTVTGVIPAWIDEGSYNFTVSGSGFGTFIIPWEGVRGLSGGYLGAATGSGTIVDLAPCRVTSLTNLTLSGFQVVDGYTLVEADRILLTGQTTPSENGIWLAHAGSWTRPTDFPSGGSTTSKETIVTGGTNNGKTVWQLIVTDSIVIDTAPQIWTSLSASIIGVAGGATTANASRTSTLASPVLRDYVNALDYNCKFDNVPLTVGGSITTGTNTFSDTTNNPFVVGDIGKTIQVPGAGASAATLKTTISGFTDSGHVLLTANAGTTVTNVAYKFGTNDTANLQTAINAVGNRPLWFPPQHTFVTSLIPKPGLAIYGYGSTVHQIAGQTNAVFYGHTTDGVTLNRGFRCQGVTFLGEGTSGTNLANQRDAIWLEQWADVNVIDCVASQFIDSAFSFRDSQRVRVIDCTIFDCCSSAGQARNAVIFTDSIFGNAANCPVTDFLMEGCIVYGTIPTAAVGFASQYTIATQPINVVIRGNILSATSGFTVVAGEINSLSGGTATGNMHGIVVEGNILFNSIGYAVEIYDSGSAALSFADPTKIQDVTIKDNICNGAIRCEASRMSLTGNVVTNGGNVPPIWIRTIPTGSTINDVIVSNNIAHQLGSATTHALRFENVNHGVLNDNFVYTDAAGTTGSGVFCSACTFTDIRNNRVEKANFHGIEVNAMSDCTISGNTVYNCNTISAASSGGIYISGAAPVGALNVIRENTIYDDRGTHQMHFAVRVATAGATSLKLLNNTMQGALTNNVSASANFTEIRGNTTDTPQAFPGVPTNSTAIVATGTPYTNITAYDQRIFLSGGTGTAVTMTRSGGSAKTIFALSPGGAMNLEMLLHPGDSYTPTWTVQPNNPAIFPQP